MRSPNTYLHLAFFTDTHTHTHTLTHIEHTRTAAAENKKCKIKIKYDDSGGSQSVPPPATSQYKEKIK